MTWNIEGESAPTSAVCNIDWRHLFGLARVCAALVTVILLAAPPTAASSAPSARTAIQETPAATEGAAPAAETSQETPPTDGIGRARQRAEGEIRGLFTDPKGTVKRWIMKDGPWVAGQIVLFFVILFIARILASVAERMMRRVLDKSARNASELFKAFVASSVAKIIFFVGLILALQNVGLDVAPILTGLGVMGFIVGFAMQDTLANFAAGIMLLLYRPYDVGHFVEVFGKEGTVESMTLVSTTLLTPDNQRLTIPNGKIWGNVIRNATANEKRRTNEVIGISYGDDISRAQELALEVVTNMEHVVLDPSPQVLVTELGDSSVNLSVRAWFPTDEYFASCCELRKAVKMRFDAENVTIPFPQRDVRVRPADAAQLAAADA